MQTLTEDQFKQKYGVIAASQFDMADKKKQKEESLFDSIKNDITARGQKNQEILSQPGSGALDAATKGFEVASNTASGVGNAIGQTLSKIPVVGGALNAIGGGIKGAYDSVVNKLGDTKFMQEAAQGVPENGTLEKGLKIASSAGEIAENILGADVGTGGLAKGTDVAKSVSSKAGEALDSIPKPDLGATGSYVKSAIRDVVPERQRMIDENLAKGLDLAPGDMSTLKAATGNEMGTWLSDKDAIGRNKAETVANIQNIFAQNYKGVRSEIDKVKQVYKPYQVPSLFDSLKAIKSSIDGVPGLGKEIAKVDNLLAKKEFSLRDVQSAKEMLDEHFSLYKAVGDVAQGKEKSGLANFRGDLKSFIEQEVKKYNYTDIAVMNNDVSTAKSLLNAIEKRNPKGLTRNNFSQRDIMIGLGLTYLNPVLGIGAMFLIKLAKSPTARLRFARFLDQQSDAAKAKISQSLSEGKVPPEAEKIVGPINESSASQVQPPQSTEPIQ